MAKRIFCQLRLPFQKRCLATNSQAVIPVVDFGRFLKGNAHDKKQFAAEMDQICTEIGFLSIVNHGVEDAVIDGAWNQTRQFFDLPRGEKCAAAPQMLQGYPYGYIPLGGETLAAGKAAEGSADQKKESAPPDLNESFSVGPEATAANDAPLRQWPSHSPEFAIAWGRYYGAMEGLSASLLRSFALALHLPEQWFADKIDQHRCALRALHYPHPSGHIPPGQLRASAHTDYGSLTILLQDGAPGGLQVKASDERSGGWTPVPREPGAFVINLGDLMSRWTNDRWVSTLHRVVMPPADATGSTRRQSMAFFHNINPDHTVECISTCHSADNPPKYEPIGAFDFLMQKHNAATGADSKK